VKWLRLIVILALIFCVLSGCRLTNESPHYLNDSERLYLLRRGEVAPIDSPYEDGIWMSRGYFLKLKRHEDKAIQENQR